MVPGYLHFDVRRGLRADMLNAAMSSLLHGDECIRKAFDSLDLHEITFVMGDNVARGVRGATLHFYVAETLITLDKSIAKSKTISKMSALWNRGSDRPQNETPEKPSAAFLTNPFLHSCMMGESVLVSDLGELFKSGKVKPTISGLALKILDQLASPIFVDQRLNGGDALWLLCHLVTLCAQIDALDPKYITATRLCISPNKLANDAQQLSLVNDLWLTQVLAMVPFFETNDQISVDVLAVAFLKALAGQFGPRGESVILKSGIGISSFQDAALGLVEALWCEAHLPPSMTQCGPSNTARRNSVHEIVGIVPSTTEIAHLCSTLSLHGALSITWHLVQGEKNAAYYALRFFSNDDDKREIIEAFLVKGSANEVSIRVVERHELNRRIVSVPIGTGNKSFSIRFCEYVYLDKTVRVEPLKEDLDHYVRQTDYSVEVARSDLLFAWKKWRGRVALEST